MIEFVEFKLKAYFLVKNNGLVDRNAKETNENVIRKINHEGFFDK